MGLNKQKGNMYPFVSHTYNPIRGRCPHNCVYCYMKGFNVGELRFVEKELETNLGAGNFIFVGSSTDMWAEYIPEKWIERVYLKCLEHPNRYLFQTKNPVRFLECWSLFPDDTLLGTTIETNRHYDFISKAPKVENRYNWMQELSYPTMISIEPIMDFDLDILVKWIAEIKPEFVSIGADSKRHNLPEPAPDKLEHLIEALQDITVVKLKDNLKRLRQELPEQGER